MVHLPKGTWINYWTDEVLQGGTHILADAPLATMPIFIKAGSIIAEGPIEQYAGEKAGADLIFNIYPGQEPIHYRHYEDDGYSFNYESGSYNEIDINVSGNRKQEGAQQLEINLTYAHNKFEVARENIIFIVHLAAKPTEVKSEADINWTYDASSQLSITLKDQQKDIQVTVV